MSSTSIRYLRQRQRQRKLENQAWTESLEQEQHEFMHMCRFRLEQANDYCHRLGKPQTFRLQQATAERGARVAVHLTTPKGDTGKGRRAPRFMSLPMFLREHAKLRDALDRGEGVAEASAAQAAANALFSASDASTSRSAAPTTGGYAPAAPAGPPSQQQQLSRSETVAQVEGLLQSTRSMTARLDAQLEEMRLHGWNAAAPRE